MTSIGRNAFELCYQLSPITFPSSITSIGDYAFWLAAVEVDTVTVLAETPPTLGTEVFSNYAKSLYVPATSLQAYQNAEGWRNFDPILPLPYILEDAKTFKNEDECHDVDISYYRTFDANVWNTWFAPFAVSTDELAEYSLTAARIDDVRDCDDDEDGTIDRTVMEIVKLTNGTLKAGTPYLIKAAKDYKYPLEFKAKTLYSDAYVHTIHKATATADYDFAGTYTGVSAAITASAGNYYSLDRDNAMVHQKGDILPLRWYMTVTTKDSQQPDAITVSMTGEEDENSGIRTLYADEGKAILDADVIYSIDGVRHTAPQSGLNIINNKIIFIR